MGVHPEPRLPPIDDEEIENAVLWENENPAPRSRARRRRSGEFIARLPYDQWILASRLPGRSGDVWTLAHHSPGYPA